jgi:hypothetical protein
MKLDQLLCEYVEKRGNEWVVLNHTKKKVLGTHPTREKALAQLRAIEINKHK